MTSSRVSFARSWALEIAFEPPGTLFGALGRDLGSIDVINGSFWDQFGHHFELL